MAGPNGQVLYDRRVAVEISPVSTGASAEALALAAYVASMGDVGALARSKGAVGVARNVVGGLTTIRGVNLDRAVKSLDHLAPRIQLPGERLVWLAHGFTVAELNEIPSLVRLYNAGIRLDSRQLLLLRRAIANHVWGASEGSPFVSFMKPAFETPDHWPAKYRVRVRFTGAAAQSSIDLTEPSPLNTLNEVDVQALADAGQPVAQLYNPGEGEVVVARSPSDGGAHITHVQSGPDPTRAGEWKPLFRSTSMRASSYVQLGGRLVFVAGLALSGYHIANASSRERPYVIGREAGGTLGAMGGASLGAAACVALGIATGGIVLFLCGAVAGILGTAAGSILGEAFVEGLLNSFAAACPSCHAMQWDREARLAGRELAEKSREFQQLLRPRDGRLPTTRRP